MKKYAEGLRLTEEDLNARASKFAREMFGWEIPKRIKIEPRFTNTYGRCWMKRKPYPQQGLELKEIKIAAFLVNGNYREEDIDDIIKHELLHWYTDMVHQRSCGHGEEYKANCRKHGVNPQSANTRPTIYQREEGVRVKRHKPKRLKKGEYHKVVCSKCKKELYRSKNKSKLIEVMRKGLNEGCKECNAIMDYSGKSKEGFRVTSRGYALTEKELERIKVMGVEPMQYS